MNTDLYLRTAVHRRCQRPPKGLGTAEDCGSNIASKHAHKHEARPPQVQNEFRPDSNDFDFICAGVSNVGGYQRNARYNLSSLLHTYCHLNTNEKLSVSWQVFETTA